jgi:hypothetical protein
MNKKTQTILFVVVLFPLSAILIWWNLDTLERGNKRKEIFQSIQRCTEQSKAYEGAQRVREFVRLLNEVQVKPNWASAEILNEFEHYRGLWNKIIEHLDKTGELTSQYDAEIANTVKKLNDS